MKNNILTIVGICLLTSAFGQKKEKELSILQTLVEKIHLDLRDVAMMSGVPSKTSVNWAKLVYVQQEDSIFRLPFDSLTSPKWNHLAYDITVEFDRFTENRTQNLQGVIVLKRISPEREEKLRNWMLKEMEKEKALKR